MNRDTDDLLADSPPDSLSPDVVDGEPPRRSLFGDDPDGVDVEAPRSRAPLSEAEIAAKIRGLEERLDEMIGEPEGTIPAPPPSRAIPPRPLTTPPEATVFDTARELLSTEFYLKKWGRLGMRNRSEEVDDFGKDPVYEQKVAPFFDFLYERYFRVECEGVTSIPPEGRCLLVANHSGTLPYDGIMIKTAVKREHPAHRDVRWLAEDFLFHFPFLGSFTNRIGAVRACQENAERLLRQESLTAVFPEGVKGIGKLFRHRYELQRFGRGGFIKLALRTGAPIVPVAVVGAEETNPMLLRVDRLAQMLGVPYIPVTPTFPLLGPLGLLPLPTKWRIVFGAPFSLEEYGPEAADDEMLVGRLAEDVRGEIQKMLDRALAKRASVWLG
jgi:1-acyl-sn-glycerol-3-phosphate acyltransferase